MKEISFSRRLFDNSTFEKELISTLKLNIECDEIIHIKVTDWNKKVTIDKFNEVKEEHL